MGIFTVTGGTVLESWRSEKAGPLGELPSILRSLEFARDDLLLLNGLSHRGTSENLNGHENCAFQHLTAAEKVGRVAGKVYASTSRSIRPPRGSSGEETFLPSMEMGLSNHETRYSFRSADEPVPYEADPRLVFDRMFRGRTPIVPNWQRRALGPGGPGGPRVGPGRLVRPERGRRGPGRGQGLRGRIGSNDRQKLDQYLDAIRSVETRIDRLEVLLQVEAADAADPGPSKLVVPRLPDKSIPFSKYRDQVHRDPEKHDEYIRIMSDLMVLAFQTDTTRVATLAVGSDEARFPGVVTVGYEHHCHTLEHQGNAARAEDADPISREACRQIHAWYTMLFAEMVRTMKAIDEGGSSLLDNTMLLYTSYMADGGHGPGITPSCSSARRAGRCGPAARSTSRRGRRSATSTSRCSTAWGPRSTRSGPARPPCPT